MPRWSPRKSCRWALLPRPAQLSVNKGMTPGPSLVPGGGRADALQGAPLTKQGHPNGKGRFKNVYFIVIQVPLKRQIVQVMA